MKTVLMLDNSQVVRAMLTRHLERYACRVVEAISARQGIEAVRQEVPDLILLDASLAHVDGRDTLAGLREEPNCASVPIIVLVAADDTEVARKINAAGVTCRLIKPFGKATFDATVGTALSAPPRPAVRC
jgi:two-component system chemotaxis response regulator CheY